MNRFLKDLLKISVVLSLGVSPLACGTDHSTLARESQDVRTLESAQSVFVDGSPQRIRRGEHQSSTEIRELAARISEDFKSGQPIFSLEKLRELERDFGEAVGKDSENLSIVATQVDEDQYQLSAGLELIVYDSENSDIYVLNTEAGNLVHIRDRDNLEVTLYKSGLESRGVGDEEVKVHIAFDGSRFGTTLTLSSKGASIHQYDRQNELEKSYSELDLVLGKRNLKEGLNALKSFSDNPVNDISVEDPQGGVEETFGSYSAEE